MEHLINMRRRLRKSLRNFAPQDRSFGTAIRDVIQKVASAAHPYVVKVIPNFRAAHYTYILFMAFFTSVIVYPITNFAYIDILFLMSGASTQAGLNTINLNELRLSQQILVYITTTLTTPIFIHGSLLFIRLFWFERHFDNIKESSKLNFKMRRNATLAARTRSTDRTGANTRNNEGLGTISSQLGHPVNVKEAHLSQVSVDHISTSSESDPLGSARPKTGSTSSDQSKSTSQGKDSGQTMYPEPSDEEGVYSASRDPVELTPTGPADGIKFVDLPKPTKRTQEIDPSDMYKSIALLQKNKRRDSGLEEDVLVIKSPNEIERDLNTPIYTTKNQSLGNRRASKWRVGRLNKGKNRWDALRKTISNSSPSVRRRSAVPIDEIIENGNHEDDHENQNHGDNESIDSEIHGTTAFSDDNDDHDDHDDIDENDNDDRSMTTFNFSDNEHAVVDSDEDLSEKDVPKRSLFADKSGNNGETGNFAETGDLKTKFAREPTIDRQKRQARHQGKRRLRKWRTPMVSKSISRTMTDNGRRGDDEYENDSDDADDDDEENDYNSAGGAPLDKVMSTNYLSWTPTIGRNSTFVHLTDQQKEELGGVEYRANKLLIKIIIFYYVGFHVIAFSFYVGFINVAKGYGSEMRDFGISPTWWGFFTAQSTFNDLGLTLTPNSMYSYSRSVYILVIASFFIVIGNTGFPIFLRFIIWVMFKTAKPLSLYKESLGFLLDHPRRCFTLLFPSVPTWWLFFILVVLNATDLILFIVLDLNTEYLDEIPVGFRILDGLFQAFSTRTAGFSVIDLSQLHPAVQVSYMIMMYISVLPLAISIRRTNVYEEQSLGVYLKGGEANADPEKTPQNFIGTHLRNQLSFDLWFIFLGLFIICIAEGGKIQSGDLRFNVFTVLFEIISAYGTVGLSLGYPNVDQSLSYKFTTVSKLVIIAMMIRGRHRGLPYALDRAIMLPDADMQKRDKVQENHAIQRAGSLSVEPTTTSFSEGPEQGLTQRLRKTISRRAQAYRRNSFFPAPTKLPEELHELRNMNRAHTNAG